MDIDTITYAGWDDCVRLSHAQTELIITTQVGPRIIRYGFLEGGNLFHEAFQGQTEGETWRNYGGHRLWHAPEDTKRTYAPDNDPVTVEEFTDFVRLSQPTEALTGIQKTLEISLTVAGARVVHRLTNHGVWGVRLAPWALSVMAPGGVAVLPLPPRGAHGEHLLPSNRLAVWPYTDLSDPRWTWGRAYILLRQDTERGPQKIGAYTPDSWAAYAHPAGLFIKTFETLADANQYPDGGVNVEVFTNQRMLEVETLGPLVELAPGASVEHVEHWALFPAVPLPQHDDDVLQHIVPHAQMALGAD